MTQSKPKFIITGGAGFIGSNLTLALQEKFPDAHLTVIDDFRSGDFKNLAGYRGDFVAENLATLDWREKFGDPAAAGFDERIGPFVALYVLVLAVLGPFLASRSSAVARAIPRRLFRPEPVSPADRRG